MSSPVDSEALSQRLQSEDDKTRLDAILDLRALQPLDAPLWTLLLQHLSHPHPGLRQAALDVLGSLAHRQPGEVPGGTLDLVLGRVHDANPRVRAEAMGCLALVEEHKTDPRRVEALRLGLEDASPEVREQALAAVGDLKLTGFEEALVKRLDDEASEVAFEAAFALASLHDSRALSKLCASLTEKSVQIAAADALARLGDPAAVPALQKALSGWFVDRVSQLSFHAALVSLGEASSLAPLLKATQSWRILERTHAYGLIGWHQVKAAKASLIRVAQDPKHRDRHLAMAALARFPEERARIQAVADDPAEPENSREDARFALSSAVRNPTPHAGVAPSSA